MLYTLSKQYCHSRLVFFRLLFGGYHKLQGELAYEEAWLMNQSTVSRIMCDNQGLTWPMRQHYLGDKGDVCLRQDVQQYVQCVVQTAQQRTAHFTSLTNLVEQSTNLFADDREYIMTYHDVESNSQLAELIFRLLRTLIRYP